MKSDFTAKEESTFKKYVPAQKVDKGEQLTCIILIKVSNKAKTEYPNDRGTHIKLIKQINKRMNEK